MTEKIDYQNKICSVSNALEKIHHWRSSNKTVVFTNGCFDIVHLGHIQYLTEAKQSSDRKLIVGLNSDISIKKIKGDQRPIIHQDSRQAVIAALSCVDLVVMFDESTPQQLIERLQPDVLIKGADWKGKTVAGSDLVLARGGEVEFITFIDNYSTTAIINKILKIAH